MLKVRCKMCNRELHSASKVQCCGCPNQMMVVDDKVTANDISQVIMLSSNKKSKKSGVLTNEDIRWQEERRKRKVRKLDFDVR